MTTLNSLRSLNPQGEKFFKSVSEDLDKARADINWYGRRVIKVSGEDGYVPLKEFSAKIVEEIRDNFCMHRHEEEEIGVVVLCLSRFYRKTDLQIARSNILIKISAAIQEFSILWMRNTRYDISVLAAAPSYESVFMDLSGCW